MKTPTYNVTFPLMLTTEQKQKLAYASKIYKLPMSQILRDFVNRLPKPVEKKKFVPRENLAGNEPTPVKEVSSPEEFRQAVQPDEVAISPMMAREPSETVIAHEVDPHMNSANMYFTDERPTPRKELNPPPDQAQPTELLEEMVHEREHAEIEEKVAEEEKPFWQKNEDSFLPIDKPVSSFGQEPKRTDFDKEMADTATNGWGEKMWKKIFKK